MSNNSFYLQPLQLTKKPSASEKDISFPQKLSYTQSNFIKSKEEKLNREYEFANLTGLRSVASNVPKKNQFQVHSPTTILSKVNNPFLLFDEPDPVTDFSKNAKAKGTKQPWPLQTLYDPVDEFNLHLLQTAKLSSTTKADTVGHKRIF